MLNIRWVSFIAIAFSTAVMADGDCNVHQPNGHSVLHEVCGANYHNDQSIADYVTGSIQAGSMHDGCSAIIDGRVDDHSTISISATSYITLGEKIDNNSAVSMIAPGNVAINDKVDNHSIFTASSGGEAHIEHEINNGAVVSIKAAGNIFIGRFIDNESHVKLESTEGNISIGGKIDGASLVCLIAKKGIIDVAGKIDNAHTRVYYEGKIPNIHGGVHGGIPNEPQLVEGTCPF